MNASRIVSQLVEGENPLMDLGTRVSTAKFTLREAPCDMDAHWMGMRERVANQREITPQQPTPEETDFMRQSAASPVAHTDEVFTCYT